MLETNGIPPLLTNQLCEELLCQQYWYQGKLVQEVDVLLLKVNGRWHQLYFDEGIVFWRLQQQAPVAVEQQAGDPFSYPLIDIRDKISIKRGVNIHSNTETLV